MVTSLLLRLRQNQPWVPSKMAVNSPFHSGIDIILEQTIPQPWRERFHQASIGSTRLIDGPYARDLDKFLVGWEAEMRHLEAHRAATSKPELD